MQKEEIDEKLKDLKTEWEISESSLSYEFKFTDFNKAMDFVNKVAQIADELDHHPDIDIRYNKVKLVLSTHTAGGVTEKDIILAGRIDALL